MDRAGRVVALPRFSEVLVHADGRDLRIGPLDDNRYAAVSPDGRWLATGGHNGGGVRVWSLNDGRRVADMSTQDIASVAFSPDGRWLMTNGGPCRLWEVGTWAETRTIGGEGVTFTPDGLALVVQDPSRVLRLVECATGRTLARLESPDLCSVWSAAFSPDGARLVVTTQDGPAVHVWDLRAIRGHLASMGLDWDAPPYPDADPASPGAPPLRRAEVDYGPYRDRLVQYTEPAEPLVKQLTARLRSDPDDAEASR
jgi:hypothetical protein